jgi:hypothetical protein
LRYGDTPFAKINDEMNLNEFKSKEDNEFISSLTPIITLAHQNNPEKQPIHKHHSNKNESPFRFAYISVLSINKHIGSRESAVSDWYRNGALAITSANQRSIAGKYLVGKVR